jgi:hypothetical protein
MDYLALNNWLSDSLVAEDKIGDLLDSLDIDYRQRGSNISFPCPIHGGDNPNGFLISVPRNNHSPYPLVFSCITGEAKGCPLYDYPYPRSLLAFVQAVRKCPVNEAVDFVRGFVSDDKVPAQIIIPDRSERTLGLSRKAVQSSLEYPAWPFINQGFDRETLDRLDIGYDPERKAVATPLYNAKGETCLGFMYRSLPKQRRSWWVEPSGFPKGRYVYNTHRARARPGDHLFVVEGIKEVIRLEELGQSAVALLGSDMSEAQMRVIISLGKRCHFICMDSDPKGVLAGMKISETFYEAGVAAFNVGVPEDFKDLGEMGRNEAAFWLATTLPVYLNDNDVIYGYRRAWLANDRTHRLVVYKTKEEMQTGGEREAVVLPNDRLTEPQRNLLRKLVIDHLECREPLRSEIVALGQPSLAC